MNWGLDEEAKGPDHVSSGLPLRAAATHRPLPIKAYEAFLKNSPSMKRLLKQPAAYPPPTSIWIAPKQTMPRVTRLRAARETAPEDIAIRKLAISQVRKPETSPLHTRHQRQWA